MPLSPCAQPALVIVVASSAKAAIAKIVCPSPDEAIRPAAASVASPVLSAVSVVLASIPGIIACQPRWPSLLPADGTVLGASNTMSRRVRQGRRVTPNAYAGKLSDRSYKQSLRTYKIPRNSHSFLQTVPRYVGNISENQHN